MKLLFDYITVLAAITIITTVLLQSRDSSLGGAFGGGDGGGYRTRRGAERTIYYLTIVSGVVFVASVLLSILAKS